MIMANLQLVLRSKDGSIQYGGMSGKQFVEQLFGDDHIITSVDLEVKDNDGKVVVISIPNDEKSNASISSRNIKPTEV